MGLAVIIKHLHTVMALPSNIAINLRAFGAGLKTASGFSPVMAGVSYQKNFIHFSLNNVSRLAHWLSCVSGFPVT